MPTPWKESYDQPRQHIKKQRHYFINQGLSSQNYVFSSSHVQMLGWTIKKAEHQRTDVFELWCWRRLERPLDSKDIQPVHAKGNQSWVLIGGTDVEAETPILGHRIQRADSLLGKIERRRRSGPQRMRWLDGITDSMDMGFHMFKLDFKKPEEPEIKLPTSVGSLKKQQSSRKTSVSALLPMPNPLSVWIQQSLENSEKDVNTRPPDLPPEEYVCSSRSNS